MLVEKVECTKKNNANYYYYCGDFRFRTQLKRQTIVRCRKSSLISIIFWSNYLIRKNIYMSILTANWILEHHVRSPHIDKNLFSRLYLHDVFPFVSDPNRQSCSSFFVRKQENCNIRSKVRNFYVQMFDQRSEKYRNRSINAHKFRIKSDTDIFIL